QWTPATGVKIYSTDDFLQFYVEQAGIRYVIRDVPNVRVGEEHTIVVTLEGGSTGWQITAGSTSEPLEPSGDTVVNFVATSGSVQLSLHKQTAEPGDWLNLGRLVITAEESPPAPVPTPIPATGHVRLEDRVVNANAFVTHPEEGAIPATLWITTNGVIA